MGLYLIFTVDVESPQTPSLQGKINDNMLSNEYYCGELFDIIGNSQLSASVFVNVYEHTRVGKNNLSHICQKLKSMSCGIQLHTHPAWVYDRKREHMWQYSLKEQIQIIKEGKELIKAWTGEYPIAHRAGAYGINKDTFLALKENNIFIDSSNFYGHPNCKEIITKNRIVERYGVIEVPVTIFFRRNYLKFGPFTVKSKGGFAKTDIDWATLDELKFFIEEAKKKNIKVMNLFIHSYSLMKFKRNFTHFKPDYNKIKKLKSFLECIGEDRDIKVITIKDFYERYKDNPDEFVGSDDIPQIEQKISYSQIPGKIFKTLLPCKKCLSR